MRGRAALSLSFCPWLGRLQQAVVRMPAGVARQASWDPFLAPLPSNHTMWPTIPDSDRQRGLNTSHASCLFPSWPWLAHALALSRTSLAAPRGRTPRLRRSRGSVTSSCAIAPCPAEARLHATELPFIRRKTVLILPHILNKSHQRCQHESDVAAFIHVLMRGKIKARRRRLLPHREPGAVAVPLSRLSRSISARIGANGPYLCCSTPNPSA